MVQNVPDRGFKIPSPPAVAVRVLEAVKDERQGFESLTRIISADPALTAKTLSLVNSSFYGLPQQITDLNQAISILGTDTIKNIALSFVIIKSYRGKKNDGFDYDYFWRRAITAAVAAEMLRTKLDIKNGPFFTAALLMDLGVILMYLSNPKSYLRVLDLKRATGKCVCEAEREVFGVDHQQVTADVLLQWSIPDEIVDLVKEHHVLKQNTPRDTILYVANLISSLYHGSNTGQKHARLKDLMETLYGITGEEFDEFIDEVATQTRETLSLFDLPKGRIKPYSELLEEANEELNRLNLSYEQMVIELKRAKEQAEALAKQLMEANEKLREMALRDGLTSLYNHRYFQETLDREIGRARRYGHPISLIMIDIDHFKKINDTYGHQQGDVVLKGIGEIIKSTIRDSDIPARYGGEEFAIILPHIELKGAVACAERLRQKVENHSFNLNGTQITVTISLGVTSTFPAQKEVSKTALIEMADRALYHSKNSGRNKVTAIEL